MENDGKRLLSIHLAVLLFGSAGLFGKLLDFSPIIIVYGRVAFASLFLGLYIWISIAINLRKHAKSELNGKKGEHVYDLRSVCLILLLGAILSIHWITFFHSIQISTVAIGLLSFSTFPIFVVFLEPLFLRSPFRIKYLYFALLTLLGVRLLFPGFTWEDAYFQGVVWGCISGFLFAFLTIINKYLSLKFKAITLAFFQNSVAFIILFPFALRLAVHNISLTEWLILALLGVVFTALSHSLFIYGLKTVKARIASIIACMEPVYGILLAFMILSETPDVRTVTGGLIIVGTTVYLSLKRP